MRKLQIAISRFAYHFAKRISQKVVDGFSRNFEEFGLLKKQSHTFWDGLPLLGFYILVVFFAPMSRPRLLKIHHQY